MPSAFGLEALAQADISSTVGAAAVFGVLFHLAIQSVEFELYMFHFIFGSILAYFGDIYALISIGNYDVLGALLKTSLFAAAFNAALLTSILIYRLFFHRCRKFPGPLGAKVSRFYAGRLAGKNVQYYKEIAKLHGQYGDFVRTGMFFRRHFSIIR